MLKNVAISEELLVRIKVALAGKGLVKDCVAAAHERHIAFVERKRTK